MTTVAKPADLVGGKTAQASHVTPLYDFLNGPNLDDGNMKPNGVDASVLKDTSILAGKIAAATSGSAVIAYAGADVTVTHNKGRQPILGCSAGISANGGAGVRQVNLKAVGANTFVIGENPAADFFSSVAVVGQSATVFYTYFSWMLVCLGLGTLLRLLGM